MNLSDEAGGVNTAGIVSDYNSGRSMRSIAKSLNTNHKLISRALHANGVATRPPKNERGKKKYRSDFERNYANMASHLRFDVDHNWLMQFQDFESVKFLNKCLTNRSGRWDISTDFYKQYLEKFYDDTQFRSIYNKWLAGGKSKYKRPTIDHIVPVSKGGQNHIDNLQFLSWFENRSKNDMTQSEWDEIKNNMGDYLV